MVERDLVNLYDGLGNLKYDFRNYNLNHLILSKIKGKSIIDIGCGSGFLLNKLQERGKEAVGIESDDEIIKLARKFNPNLKIIKGRAEDIDLLVKKKVDVISMIDVLEHIKEDKLLLRKIYDKLNSEGKVILVVPAFPFLYGKRDKNNKHHRRYSKNRLIGILRENKFKIKEIRYWNMLGFFPYFFYEKVLRKALYVENRTEKEKRGFSLVLNNMLNLWMSKIENKINLGFGLSLICVAEK